MSTAQEANILTGKNILILGGTGSFGSAFVDKAITLNPKVIRVFSRGELLQLEQQRKYGLDNIKIRWFIGDVRDRYRLFRATKDVDIIINAAALKQVPACQYNPVEAKATNIDGAVNVIDAAIDNGIKKVIFISSDKSASPYNLYGATKLVAEHLFVQGNSYSSKTRFSVVRYGNVVGSRGSVIPLWKEQAKNGILDITDEHMTRFWITLGQGVDFVISCLDRMQGGEIFIPKIPSMHITDLAKVIAPYAKLNSIGIRTGEKLHEMLISENEARHTREFSDYFVIQPEHPFWGDMSFKEGKYPLYKGAYASNTNDQWLTQETMGKMLKEERWL